MTNYTIDLKRDVLEASTHAIKQHRLELNTTVFAHFIVQTKDGAPTWRHSFTAAKGERISTILRRACKGTDINPRLIELEITNGTLKGKVQDGRMWGEFVASLTDNDVYYIRKATNKAICRVVQSAIDAGVDRDTDCDTGTEFESRVIKNFMKSSRY